MKLVYIAGPYTSSSDWEVERNIWRARELGATVAKLGAFPVIPHANTAHMGGIQDTEFWYRGTLALCEKCDALITVSGWNDSEGSKSEVQAMLALERPVFHNIESLSSWLHPRPKSMTFSEALAAARKGKKIRRHGLNSLRIEDNVIVYGDAVTGWCLTLRDLEATDWEIVE